MRKIQEKFLNLLTPRRSRHNILIIGISDDSKLDRKKIKETCGISLFFCEDRDEVEFFISSMSLNGILFLPNIFQTGASEIKEVVSTPILTLAEICRDEAIPFVESRGNLETAILELCSRIF